MSPRKIPHRQGRLGPHGGCRLPVARALCLVLAASLLGGCAVGAAVGAMSAVTTAGVLAGAVEDALRYAHKGLSLVVKNQTEVYTGPGEEYVRIGRLNRGAQIQVLAEKGDWLRCTCGLFEDGWIHRSRAVEL